MKKPFFQLYDLVINDKVLKSDIIVWLQGDRYDRAKKVLELHNKKWAPKILITGNNTSFNKNIRPEENNVSLKAMHRWLIMRGVKKNDILVDDQSINTKEQAKNVIRMAKINDWKKIILVGSSFYQPRALLTFLKQAKKLSWPGKIINQPVILKRTEVPSGRKQSVEKLFNEEISKIKKYKKDLVNIRDGIKYFENKYSNL
jgi:uncharacterized SAM-binding protein YcdF (DUF218 family)